MITMESCEKEVSGVKLTREYTIQATQPNTVFVKPDQAFYATKH
jgi:hypothetical protein